MNTFAEYLIKSGLSLCVLYFFYWLVMRKGTHFRLNRMVLLFSLLASLLLPVIGLDIFASPKFQASLPEFTVSMNEFVVNATKPLAHPSTDWMKILSVIYFAGATIVIGRLIYQGIYLLVMSKLSKTIRKGAFTIVLMNADITPFAYFKKIFMPVSNVDEYSIESILAHERSHLQQYHFFDLFVMEFLTVLQWFNPIVWIYERSIKEVHEYLADEAVLNTGHNKGIYQALLVNQAMGGPVFSLTNQFNQSLIKKRIIMMTKMKTPRFAQLKALLVLPLVSLLLLAFANPKSIVKPILQKGNELLNNASVSSTERKDESSFTATLKDTTKKAVTPANVQITESDDAPVKFADKMPQFPGGVNAMMKFLSQHMKYPAIAKEMGINGRVMVQFIVNKVGKVENAKVLRGIGGGCDEEALRVVNLFPTWEPGENKDNKVSVYYTLPIVFSLKEETGDKKAEENEQTPLKFVEKMPQFPGGSDSLMKFLNKNIKYPSTAEKLGITGRVIIQFVINKTGKVSDPKLLRGIGGGCDEEAIRVVNLMPIWKPGQNEGKEVDVYFTLPIVFLQKK